MWGAYKRMFQCLTTATSVSDLAIYDRMVNVVAAQRIRRRPIVRLMAARDLIDVGQESKLP